MVFLSKREFSRLSEPQKSDYYDELLDEKNNALTVSQLEALIPEFEKLNYKDSDEMAEELEFLAAAQRKADVKYNLEKRKKGLLIMVLVACAAVLVATATAIITMF